MGSKSQDKKEREKRRRQNELKGRRRQLDARRGFSESHTRHQQRMLAQVPQAWAGETAEDVAIFDDAALESLPEEWKSHALAVRAALQDAVELRSDEALSKTSTISRSSPFSQWRLFIRGLVDWLAGNAEAAGEAWRRLEVERRPGRIAIAMMAALRPDLDHPMRVAEHGRSAEESSTPWSGKLSPQLLYHAKLLRRTRFDRVALKTAQTGLSMAEESKKLQLGPRKIRWLQQFIREHQAAEPDLTTALAHVALGRAYTQVYTDVFEEAVRAFRGPRHDPRNLLLTFFYFVRFSNDAQAEQRAERALEEYLNRDLPQNKDLSEPLRAAIASHIHLQEAKALMDDPETPTFMSWGLEPEDAKAIRQHLRTAVKTYPAHRAVYQAHVGWVESKLANDRLTNRDREPWERELANVMQAWSSALPEDAEPRLWLVDYLLEHERTAEAKPHVDWTASARQDDPRVRATPWKWQLLEASRLCRRKTWLEQVPQRLEEAERLWPEWLSRQWLPYWKVALSLRMGERGAFELRRQKLCEEKGLKRDSLIDACMMLGAVQWLRVPSADIKIVRGPVDSALQDVGRVPLEQLLDASVYFWDLHRTQLLYPAYRMHGGKLAKELFARLSKAPEVVLKDAQDVRVQAALLWCSEHRFWSDGYQLNLPTWYSVTLMQQQPIFAAAKVNAWLKLRSHWNDAGVNELSAVLREAAPLQHDSFYRHWFLSLAQQVDDALTRSRSRGLNLGPLGAMFGALGGDLDADDSDDGSDPFDDGLEFDPNCNCAACQAAKRASESRRR